MYTSFVRMRNGGTAPPTFLHHMIPRKMSTGTRLAELERELFSACLDRDLDRVRRVIAAGVDPKKATNKDYFEETPLHTACRYVPSSSVHVVPRSSIPSIKDEEVSACSTHISPSSHP